MPPFLAVESLYSSCLLAMFRALHHAVRRSPEGLQPLRRLVLAHLHAGIRQHLIQLAAVYCRRDVYVFLDLLEVLLDAGVHKVDHSEGCSDAWLPVDQCAALYSRLDQCAATGLHELTVKVRLHPRQWGVLQAVSAANSVLHRVLRRGMASTLHTLVLCSACDNETLRLLGRHSHHLRYLDVTSSWLVDDGGLRQLCLQEPDQLPASEDMAARSFLAVPPGGLTRCCHTLQQVRIQDTNTSEVGVIMLLLLIPNLRSLGGFIYYRNVGDAIVALQQLRPGVELRLTDLWDTCLPPDKGAVVARAVPHVSTLYTRGNCLASAHLFPALAALTVDFDFCHFIPLLEDFLGAAGARLRKLVIVDQNFPVDLAMLADYCPNLEEVGAYLQGEWEQPHQLRRLATCRIRISCPEPFTSLLAHAAALDHLEVVLEEPFGKGASAGAGLADAVVARALAPACKRRLATFLVKSECALGIATVHHLLALCPRLHTVGDLHLWAGVGERDVHELARDVRERNLDVCLRYRGSWPARPSTSRLLHL